ncbi:hypothetical protein [Flaviflagellibacter deserti]|uniref:Uncharacterized protein n=1 Tax=Flaviflagellibacter deserti TaxID=2267266 RepID=A0ABV9Z0K7_9HYPH
MGQLSEVHEKLLLLRLGIRALLADTRRNPPPPSLAELHDAGSRQLKAATRDLWNALDALHGKANFDPNQPRVPRGNADGGQWTDTGGRAGGTGGPLQTGRASSETPPNSGDQPPLRVTIEKEPSRPWLDRFFEGEDELSIEDENFLLAAVGHHFFPVGKFKKLPLSKAAKKIFRLATTGAFPGHGWSQAHKEYSDAVEELFKDFIRRRGIVMELMTTEEAEDFIREIQRSENPKIRDFNRRAIMRRFMHMFRTRVR